MASSSSSPRCPFSPEVQDGLSWNRQVDRTIYSAEDMPEYPARTLIVHILNKGLQMGSLFGLIIITPSIAIFRKQSFGEVWKRAMPLSAMLGTVACAGLLTYKAQDPSSTPAFDAAGVDDRAYRLAKHEGQTKMDKYAFVGGLIGGGVGGVILRSALVASTSTGIAFGSMYYAAEKAEALDQVKKILRDNGILEK